MKILLVDDDSASLELLARMVGRGNHEVTRCDNGQKAWELCQKQHFQVVITDWRMPELTGVELTQQIRSLKGKPYTYILLVTGLTSREHFLEAMTAGADDFLTKPYDGPIIAARLRVAERILALTAEVSELRGLVPTCSYCHKVRDEQEKWHPMETYFQKRAPINFSHGICPTCFTKHCEVQ